MLLLTQGVNFQYNAVCRYRKILALHIPIRDIVHHFLQRLAFLHSFRHLESPTCTLRKILIMTVGRQLLAKQIIEVGIKASLCHDTRVLRFQCPRSGIARICEKPLPTLLTLGIEPAERLPREKNLSTNLESFGIASCHILCRKVFRKLQRDATYCTYILRDIIATDTVAARYCTDKTSVLVCK